MGQSFFFFFFARLTVTQLLKKLPAFYETQRFIIMFTKTYHWSLFCLRWIHFTPFFWILSSHLCLGLSCGLLPFGFPTQIFYVFLISRACHTPTQSPPSWFDHHNDICEELQVVKWNSWLCSFLCPPSLALSPIQIFFSSPCSTSVFSLHVQDVVSPIQNNSKIIASYFLSFAFLGTSIGWEDREFQAEWCRACSSFNLFLVSSWIQFHLLFSFPDIQTLPHNRGHFIFHNNKFISQVDLVCSG